MISQVSHVLLLVSIASFRIKTSTSDARTTQLKSCRPCAWQKFEQNVPLAVPQEENTAYDLQLNALHGAALRDKV